MSDELPPAYDKARLVIEKENDQEARLLAGTLLLIADNADRLAKKLSEVKA